MKLYVGNLPYSTTEDELRDIFARAGTVTSVAVIKDRETGRSKGFGFVEMSSQSEGEKAIQMFNGFSLGRRELKVNEARPREDRKDNFQDRRSGFRDRGPRPQGGRPNRDDDGSQRY